MILHTDPPTIDPETDERRYVLDGGFDYPPADPTSDPAPVGSLEWTRDTFLTLEDALNAWVRRRNSPAPRWAAWGASLQLDGDQDQWIVALVDADDRGHGTWTLRQALDLYDRSDELALYVD